MTTATGGNSSQGNDQGANNQQGATVAVGGGTQAGGAQGSPLTFDAWLGSQDDQIKGLIDTHVTGLKSALDSERNERKGLTRQLNELRGKAEKGSELETQLTQLSAQLESQSAKAQFYESAPGDVANMKLAWTAAQQDGLIRDGKADWDGLRRSYPELFRSNSQAAKPPAGNAGSGRGQQNGSLQNMNSFIRQAAGRNG